MPAPRHPVITWPRAVDLDAGLHHCIRHCYDILHDDIDLRRSLGDTELPRRFDELRRNYHERQEFAGFSVVGLPREENTARARLRGLGFRVE